MTLLEMAILVGGAVGFIVGATMGFNHAGVLGAVVGGVGGVFAGWLGCVVLLLPLVGWLAVGDLIRRTRTRRALTPCFGRFWVSSQATAWAEVARTVPIGRRMKAVVVLKNGRWFVDLGVGFPGVVQGDEVGLEVNDSLDVIVVGLEARERHVLVEQP